MPALREYEQLTTDPSMSTRRQTRIRLEWRARACADWASPPPAHAEFAVTNRASPRSSTLRMESNARVARSSAVLITASAPRPFATSIGPGPRSVTAHWSTNCSPSPRRGSAANVVLVGPNGLGKTVAQEPHHQAVRRLQRPLHGLPTCARLAAQDSSTASRQSLAPLHPPLILAIDDSAYSTTPVTPICC